MQWSELYSKEQEPSSAQIREFVNTPLWDDLTLYLEQAYNARPQLFYSCCSMDRGTWKGWNVKYKKSGKPLCSLYPKQDYYIALIAIGTKEMAEASLLIHICDEHTRNLFHQTKSGSTGKSLAIEVTNEDILRDVKNLIALRVAVKQ